MEDPTGIPSFMLGWFSQDHSSCYLGTLGLLSGLTSVHSWTLFMAPVQCLHLLHMCQGACSCPEILHSWARVRI